MSSATILERTPLYEEHVNLKAKMVPFGGWEMPVQYEGILAEYQHTREKVSLFDISHMGEFIIEGDCRSSGLDEIVTMPLEDMPILTCRYGAMLNEEGGVIDDLIVFRLKEKKWFLVVNAACIEKDAEHIEAHLKEGAVFQDVSAKTGKLDLQGPLSRDILNKYVEGITKLEYYTFNFFELLGEKVLISRTGYTGELGYEIYFPSDKIKELWKELLVNPQVKPAGLGARDLLRLEMGYSLYGHELLPERSILESGLTKFIDFDKEFIGKIALAKQKQEGLSKKIVGLVSQNRRSPREGQNVFDMAGAEIGTVTSGGFSPHLQKGIGLALLKIDQAGKDTEVFFGNEKTRSSARISGRIFYKNGSVKN